MAPGFVFYALMDAVVDRYFPGSSTGAPEGETRKSSKKNRFFVSRASATPPNIENACTRLKRTASAVVQACGDAH